MMVGTKAVPSSPAELLGDTHPLLEQLGNPEELPVATSNVSGVEFTRVSDLPSLRTFLSDYSARVLVPVELPAVVAAYNHALAGEAKELIALDARMARDTVVKEFALASCRVGQRQLSKLRPLRDQRVVQRYLAAIEAGEARGWHTLVYGVSLAMYSLPLRQGLQNYIEQTTQGFVERAAVRLRLRVADCAALTAEHFVAAPALVSAALPSVGLRAC